MSEAAKMSLPIKAPGQSKVWNVVEKVIKGHDKPIKFSIQEIPEDRYEDVVDLMCSHFIADEPMCVCLRGRDNKEYIEYFRMFWRKYLREGLSVAAFVENPDGGKPIVVGSNILSLSIKGQKEEEDDDITEESVRLVMETIFNLYKTAGIYEKYGVDRYLSAVGLCVHPSYRGAALGAHILNARENIGREYKIPVTATGFTSPISQKLADRCGFETISEKNYADILDSQGNPAFPGITAKCLKIMAKRLY